MLSAVLSDCTWPEVANVMSPLVLVLMREL